MSQPNVTVIVLNWCKEKETAECLQSLLSSEYTNLSILLVDNGSPDGSGARLRAAFPGIGFLQTGKNLGYAGGNNRWIEHARESDIEYVLILNIDTVLDLEAVNKLVSTAEEGDGKVGGVVPKLLYHDEPQRIWYAGGAFSALHGLGLHWCQGDLDQPNAKESVREVTFMTGACCLISVAALRELGGFDENFFAYVEDADLSLRMNKAGYQMYYQPEARVLHRSPLPGTPPSPFQIRQRDRNRRRIMSKHASLGQRMLFLARFSITRALLFLGYTFKGDLQRAIAILQGLSKD